MSTTVQPSQSPGTSGRVRAGGNPRIGINGFAKQKAGATEVIGIKKLSAHVVDSGEIAQNVLVEGVPLLVDTKQNVYRCGVCEQANSSVSLVAMEHQQRRSDNVDNGCNGGRAHEATGTHGRHQGFVAGTQCCRFISIAAAELVK